jgi:hypothetical protein
MHEINLHGYALKDGLELMDDQLNTVYNAIEEN